MAAATLAAIAPPAAGPSLASPLSMSTSPRPSSALFVQRPGAPHGLGLSRRSSKLATSTRTFLGVVRAIEEPPTTTTTSTSTSTSTTTTVDVDTEKLVSDLKEKFDKIENKPGLALYTAGAFLTLWVANAVVGAVDALPVVPKFLELVGAGYTAWFVYRYLLFKSSRKELAELIEELKAKVTGSTGAFEE